MSDKKIQPPGPPPDHARLREEAADWIARLESAKGISGEPSSDLEQRAFLDWVRQSIHHYRAFFDVSRIHHEALPAIGARRKIDVAALVARARQEARAGEEAQSSRYSRPFPWYRLAAALVVAAVAVYYAWLYLHPALPDQVLFTRVGEVKAFTFADGTRAALDTDTRIVVHYTATRRRVDVVRGNALFAVAHDKERPFTSCVGGILLADIGTEYAAEVSATGARVTVRSGKVEVVGPCSSGATSQGSGIEHRVLEAGQHADINLVASRVETKVSPLTPHEMDVALAWERGYLIFDSVHLSQAIAEINRYLPRKLVFGDAALADVLYGGTVRISVLEKSILSSLEISHKIIPDPARTTALQVVLIPAPGIHSADQTDPR